ncbi:MAG TPA: putative DNA-binding protein [Clostridiales bacterium]|nr:putative DNA-binding protein [Clostridiales bacterium]
MSEKGKMIDKLDEVVELSILYDFYGELLSDHKKHIFEEYVHNDLSLSEIAELNDISRQGVYDIVKRCSKELRDYESKLKLISKFDTVKDKLLEIKELVSKPLSSNRDNLKEKITTLADDILKEL